MIDIIANLIKDKKTQQEKYNFLREHLQLLVLKILDEKGFFKNLSFVGGTALRILYDLKRFSEDLDFCLVDAKDYDFMDMLRTIQNELSLANLHVRTKGKSHKTVASAFIYFEDLLQPLNLSPHKDQKLSIKFEVDQNPLSNFNTTFSMINKSMLIGINHFDLPSLFGGKLHAILCRKYTKGRDIYDLIWYLGKNIKPNYAFLNQAILQTEDKRLDLNRETLIAQLKKKFNEENFKLIRDDIIPFLENPEEIRFFEKDFLLKIMEQLL
ncbi:MAG: nucleotidyl transferase AbiEii/AbiGii toxin family protein [Gammaproteobacteria bacterium]